MSSKGVVESTENMMFGSVATAEDYARWRRWGRHRFLTIRQAAMLLSGHEPTVSLKPCIPNAAAEAMQSRITQCVLLGELPPLQAFEWPPYSMDEEPEPIDREGINLSTRLCAYRTAIAAIDIALWAEKEGIPHNWRFKELCEPAITNKPAPAIPYTEELQAAIDAYEAVRGNPEATQGRTPRKALLSWLEGNRPNLGAKARDRIATMCNWEPQGGAPATPTGRGSE